MTEKRISDRLPAQSCGARTSTHLGRILVVEDLEQNQDLMKAILTAAGHEVEIASDGSEAIAAVQTKKFDLVLMDIQMPGVDGVAATRKIRALDHPAKDIPIIAMTANVLPQQVASFQRSGMNDHVGKPFRRAELIAKVANWLPKAVGRDGAGATALRGQCDEIALNELRSLMGVEWIVGGLTKLKQELGGTLRAIDPTTLEREELARKAHMLVSHAAMFGFSELAQAMAKLEEASTSGEDVRAPLEAARRAADHAGESIVNILRQMGSKE